MLTTTITIFTAVRLPHSSLSPSSPHSFLDLTRLFNPLFDAHTLYRFPAGYAGANFVRPYSIETVLGANNTQEFYLRQGPMGDEGDAVFKQLFGFDPRKFVNRRIQLIGSKNPVDYFLDVASKAVGNYKDPQVRFNQLMRVRGWGFVPLIRFSLYDLEPYDTFLLGSFLPGPFAPIDFKLTRSCGRIDGGELVITTNLIVYPGGLTGASLIEKNKFKPSTSSSSSSSDYLDSINAVQLKNVDPHKPFYQVRTKWSTSFNPASMISFLSEIHSRSSPRNRSRLREHCRTCPLPSPFNTTNQVC